MSIFGASGRLCFVIVAFPGYLHLYLCTVCLGLFALPLGVIGRLCSLVVALSHHENLPI